MSSIRKNAILVFAKSPLLGSVKTRLQSVYTAEQCLSLHVAFLQDTISIMKRLSVDLIVYFSSETTFSFRDEVPIKFQRGDDLGEKMSNAFADELERYRSVIIVGTDCPAITTALLEEALRALEENEVVLGPSQDGGYYLIGMRVAIPEIFANIRWGTSEVLQKTLTALAGRKFYLLQTLYDVDRPEDLIRLEEERRRGLLSHLPHARSWLVRNFH